MVLQVFAEVDGFTTFAIHQLPVMIQFISIHNFLGAQKRLDSRFQIILAFRSKSQVLEWFFQSYVNWSGLNQLNSFMSFICKMLLFCPLSSQPTWQKSCKAYNHFYVAGTSKRVALIDVILCHCLPCIPALQYFIISSWHVIWTQHWLRESAKADIGSHQKIDIQLLYMYLSKDEVWNT